MHVKHVFNFCDDYTENGIKIHLANPVEIK